MASSDKDKLKKIDMGSKIKFKTFKELNTNEISHPSYSKFSGNEAKVRIKFNDGYVVFLKNYSGEFWISENFILETSKSIKRCDEKESEPKQKNMTLEKKLEVCSIETIGEMIETLGIRDSIKELKDLGFNKDELIILGFDEEDI